MNDPATRTRSAPGRILAASAAYALYALLLWVLVEGWLSGSALKWLATAVLLGYAGVTALLWKRSGYAGRAQFSLLILILLLAGSTWRLGSAAAPGGLTLFGLSTSTLAHMALLGAIGAAAYLVATLPFLPRLARWSVLGVALYGALPFILGLGTGRRFDEVVTSSPVTPGLPFWVQGGVISIVVLLPLGLLAAVYQLGGALRARAFGRAQAWAFAATAIALCVLLAVPDGFRRTTPGATRAGPGTRDGTPDVAGRLALPGTADLREAHRFTPRPAERFPVPPDQLVPRAEVIQRQVPQARYDLAARARGLAPGADAALAFVRDHIRYEAYSGVLRGAQGAYAARGGNALDRSLLLAELLKQQGVAVRFATGRLSRDRAERLFQRIFEPAKPEEGLTGAPPGPAAASDSLLARLRARAARDYAVIREALGSALPARGGPAREQVLGEIERHAWVQAQIDGRWVDLDSAFADAVPARAYAAPEQIADVLPETAYQRVTLRVVAEYLAGGNLRQQTALEHTSTAATLLDREVFLVHVKQGGLAGGIAGGVGGPDLWTPALWIGGRLDPGTPINLSDQVKAPERGQPPAGGLGGLTGPGGALSSGEQFVAEWIEFEIAFPDGRRDLTRRVLIDRAGAAWRAGTAHDPAGLRPLARDAQGLTEARAVHNIWFSAGRHNLAAYAEEVRLLAMALRPIDPGGGTGTSRPAPGTSPPQPSSRGSLAAQLGPFAVQTFPMLILSDHLIVPALNDSPERRFYADSPRILIVSFGPDPQSGPDGVYVLHDLRRDHLRGLARTSQAEAGLVERKIWFGLLQGALEHEMALQYASALGSPMSAVTSTSGLVTGDGVVVLRPGEAIPSGAPPETAARLAQAQAAGSILVIPRPALRGGSPGWWEISAAEADTRSVVGDVNPARFGGSSGGGGRSWGVDPNTYRSTSERRPGTEAQAVSALSVAIVAAVALVVVGVLIFLIYAFVTEAVLPALQTGSAADQTPR